MSVENNDFIDDVRVTGSHGDPAAQPADLSMARDQRRTEQQRHTDQALKAAEKAAASSKEDAETAIAWLKSVGAQIPTRLETAPVVLGQLIEFVENEKGRRK